eukprot:s1148_g15.t1
MHIQQSASSLSSLRFTEGGIMWGKAESAKAVQLLARQYAESSFALKRPKMAAALRPRLQELARTWRSARTFAMRAEGSRSRAPETLRPVARLKEALPRQLALNMGHPWIYDDEVSNIGDLNGVDAGTLVDIISSDGATELGVGVLNRQASIVLRRMEGLSPGMEVTQELLQARLRKAFAARDQLGGGSFCRAVHGEQDGLPGVIVDRFGKSAVVIFESVGSAKLELVVQEELTRWIGKLRQLTVHRMTAKKEKWAQEGSEFTTSITRGDSSKVRVEEGEGSSQLYFDIDVLQGVLVGHWNYGLEKMRRELTACFGQGTVLDAWAQAGQWGIRCAKAGAEEVVLLEDTLGLAKLCRENAILNGVEEQCTILHRGDVASELRNMATSGIRFNCVSLNIRVRFERYFKHQRGQFGKWYKPSLKGYERAITLGAMVTSRGGYLVVTFLLPLTTEYWALCLVQGALERASRIGSIIHFSTGINEDSAMPSSTMDEFWTHVLICVKLS